MEVVEALAWRGGTMPAALLRHLTSRRKVRTALKKGQILRPSRGTYALPDAEEARLAAARLAGVASHLSAAQLNGWELKWRPDRPTVTVPRNRKVEAWRRRGIDVRWRDLDEEDVWNARTRAGRTVIDCAKGLPFDEALTVADSALRHGNVTQGLLLRLAEEVVTSGRRQCLRVAREASGQAANPFESVLRAIALGVPGLAFEPQVVIDEDGFRCRPDLVDVGRRLVLEAESFEFHGRRTALERDCERYNALGIRGWLVLRFTWAHVMHDPAYVTACLTAVEVSRGGRGRRSGPAGSRPAPPCGSVRSPG
jgi:very-short-patch-repair endonuclease